MALGIDQDEKKPLGQGAQPKTAGAQPSVGNQPTAIQRPNPQRKATGFTNIGRMLQASQGSGLGKAVAGGISGQAGQAKTGLQGAQQQFGEQSQQARIGTGEDVQRMQSVLADPTKATDEDVAAFQKFRTQGYTGPQSLKNADILRAEAEQAQQMGKAISSQSGRLGLLERFAGGPGQYSGGQKRLDELLLGRSAGSQLREARKGAAQAAGEVGRGIQTAQGLGQQFGKEAEEFKGLVTGKIGEQEKSQTDVLQARKQQEEQKKLELGKSLQEGLQSGELTPEMAEMLGLKEGQRTYGVDLSNYLKSGGPATLQNVSSAEEMAKMNALSRLGGHDAFSAKPEEAGSFMKNQFNIDPQAQEAMESRKKEYEQQTAAEKQAQQSSINKYSDYLFEHMPEIQAEAAGPQIPEGASEEERQQIMQDWNTKAPEREQARSAAKETAKQQAISALEAGQSIGGPGGYGWFADLASGGGGGYDALQNYLARKDRLGQLEQQYGGGIRFKGIQGLIKPPELRQ